MNAITQRRVAGATALMIVLYMVQAVLFGMPSAAAQQPEMVTICHAAGHGDEPANWVTLTLPWQAVYGPGGHFNENGTPQAGHEDDYLGECVENETLPDPEIQPGLASAAVTAGCVNGEFVVTENTANATIDYSADPATAAVGTLINWNASAVGDNEFEGDAPSGSFTVLDCTTPTVIITTEETPEVEEEDEVEVAGITIEEPEAPEVMAETLPFTGFDSGYVAKLGLLALLAGILTLFSVSGVRQEEAVT